jgi:uroporphyrinogen-III synthase
LQTLVSQSGYQAILFPSLKVEPLSNAPLKSHYDVLIFISSNAVEYSSDKLQYIQLYYAAPALL